MRHTGQYWAKHLIDFLWRQSRTLWLARNEQVHKPDEEGINNPVDRRDLQNKIRQLYMSENGFRAADKRNFFAQPVEEVIKGTTRTLKAWLTTNEPAIKRRRLTPSPFLCCAKGARKAIGSMRKKSLLLASSCFEP